MNLFRSLCNGVARFTALQVFQAPDVTSGVISRVEFFQSWINGGSSGVYAIGSKFQYWRINAQRTLVSFVGAARLTLIN